MTVWADSAVTLIADHGLYLWQRKDLANPLLAPSPAVSTDFALGYLLSTKISPSIFNTPGTTLSFETLSTAPRQTEVALIHFNDGSILPMDYIATSGGVSKYTLSWVLPSGASQARYPYRSCIVNDATAGATCDTTAALLSEVASNSYTFDATPPTITSWSPTPDRDTLLRRPSISAVLGDALSGLAPASFVMRLNGAPVAAVFNSSTGAYSFTPASDLTLDQIHVVEVVAADVAGNVSTASWRFNLAGLTTTPGTALVAPISAQYPPLAESVTFTSIPVELTRSVFTLSSSMRAAAGVVTVILPTTQLSVVFRPAGQSAVESDPVHPLGARTFPQDFAVLAASQVGLQFEIDAQTRDVGPVTVTIPAAYRAAGGEAVLRLVETNMALNAPVAGPLPMDLDCAGTGCLVRGTVDCTIESASAASACEGTRANVFVETPEGKRQVVGGQLSTLHANSTSFGRRPPKECAPNHVCEWIPDQSVQARFSSFSIPGLFEAHSHHHLLRVTGPSATTPRVAAYQMGDVQPGSAVCRSGAPGVATAKLRHFGQSIEVLRGYAPTIERAVTSGSPMQPIPSREQVITLPTSAAGAPVGSYRLEATAYFHNETRVPPLTKPLDGDDRLLGDFLDSGGLVYDDNGTLVAGPGAYNAWSPIGTGERSWTELLTGTEFGADPTANADGADYAFVARNHFEFVYDGAACT